MQDNVIYLHMIQVLRPFANQNIIDAGALVVGI